MKIIKHEKSQIFDAYVEQMTKFASAKGEVLEEAAKAIGKGLGVAEEAAVPAGKVVKETLSAAELARDLAQAEQKASVLTKELKGMRVAVDAAATGRPVPSRYRGWDRKKFLEEMKKAREAAKQHASEIDELKRTGELTQTQLNAANKALESLGDEWKATGDILSSLSRQVTEFGEAVTRVEKEVAGIKEDIAGLVAKIEAKTGKAVSKETVIALDDTAEIAEKSGKDMALLKASKEAGLDDTVQYKMLEKSISENRKLLENLASKVETANPGTADDIAEAIAKATKESEERMATQMAKALKDSKSPKAAKDSIMKWFLKPVVETALGGAASLASGMAGIASFALLLAAIGGGIYYWYTTSGEKNPILTQEILRQINELSDAIKDAIRTVRPLRFKELTNGEGAQVDILDSLSLADEAMPEIKSDITPERSVQIGELLDEVYRDTSSFLRNESSYRNELAVSEGYQEALDALYRLKSILDEMQGSLYEAADLAEGLGPRAPGPVGRGAETGPPELPIDVYGETIDISHLSRDLRSSIMYLADKRLNNPVYQAFIDPANLWGGAVQKTGNKEVDYLQSLKTLALNNLTTPGKVRDWMESRVRKMGTKRKSGWKSAIREYRQKGNRLISNKKQDKTANLSFSDEFSINSGNVFMKKVADQFANSYYQDAIKGLGEQYAKSYYAGLKGMYEQNFGSNSEADFNKLYQTHDETGAELLGSAHPDSAYMVDAMGNGGLVENVLEQQRRNIGVALSTPTGNFRARHAWVIESLVKLANKADEDGLFDASDLIDSTINNLSKIE